MSDPRPVLVALSRTYAEALDRRDEGSLRAIFAADAVLETCWAEPDREPACLCGIDAIVSITRLLERWTSTLHLVGRGSFESHDDGTASGTVPCVAHHFEHADDGAVDLVMVITYHDRYADRGQGWRISSRRVVIERQHRRHVGLTDPIRP